MGEFDFRNCAPSDAGATPRASHSAIPNHRACRIRNIRFAIFMSRSEGSTDNRLSGGRNLSTVTEWGGRLNSRSPSAPWILPNPDSPTPPNGRLGGTVPKLPTLFTETAPLRIRRAVCSPFFLLRLNTDAPRP